MTPQARFVLGVLVLAFLACLTVTILLSLKG